MEEFLIQSTKTIHEFQRNNILCDVIFIDQKDDVMLTAHRVILASKSEYFKAMFTLEMKESRQKEVKLEFIKLNILQKLIDFCYNGEIAITYEDVEEMLAAAHMMNFEKIEEKCIEFLLNNITEVNCLFVLNLSDMYSSVRLEKAAFEYVVRNFRQIVNKNTDFLDVTHKQMRMLISSNSLNILSEVDVYEAVLKWVRHNLEERVVYLQQLLAYVQFHTLTKKFLIDVVTQESLIVNNSQCRQFLYKALDYHLVPERRNSLDYHIDIPRVNIPSMIFIVGGKNHTGVLASCEVFSINGKKWNRTNSLTTGRMKAAVVLLDGFIYCLGGIDKVGNDLSTVEVFCPSEKKWKEGMPMKNCKGVLSATVMEGWLYAVGGSHGTSSLKCVERYDTMTREWTQVHQMRFPRSSFGLGVLGNKVCAIGGHCGINEIAHCEIFEPCNDQWTSMADLNKPRMNHCVVTVPNSDKIFVVGGKNFTGVLDCIEKYNASLNMWLIIKHTLDPRLGATSLHVNFHGELDSNFILILGGMDKSHHYQSTTKRVDLTSSEYFIETAENMLEPRAFPGSILI